MRKRTLRLWRGAAGGRAGGVQGCTASGASGAFGFRAVTDRVRVHDLHATLLHLLGIDHGRLTHRPSGRDFRLTHVYGNVVTQILRGC